MKLKEDSEREKSYKTEINVLKEEEHKYNLLKQQKINDYFTEKNVAKMKARNQRIGEFK